MKTAENRALYIALILLPFFAQACAGLKPVEAVPFSTPVAWATPGGLETSIAQSMAQSTEMALDEENRKDKNATPRPGMIERQNVNICHDNKNSEACSTPVHIEVLNQYINDWQIFLSINKDNGQISPNSSDMVLDALSILSDEIDANLEGTQDSIKIDFKEALFPESDGGKTRISPIGPKELSIVYPPKIEFFLPQASLNDPTRISQNGTKIHEILHGAWRIKKHHETGSFEVENDWQEELSADFYGNVAQLFLAKSLGIEQNPQFRGHIEENTETYGTYFPFLAWFLDQNGITPDNSLYEILYQVHGYYNAQTMYLKYRNDYDLKLMEEYRKIWNEYPWTDQEKEFLLKLFQAGAEQGYMKKWAYPDFP
jgi:hypothetical protein